MTTEPSCASQGPYRPDWESLDRHPLPEWFDDAKFAMFIHYGPYSSEQCGAHEFMKPECLTGEKYDPRQWVRIAADAGMRYIIFTTKHGGGYAMYDSDHTRWCSVHSGPRRDFFGELVEACREEGMRIFAYYCKGDIFLPTDARTYHFLIKDREKFGRIVEQYGMRSITEHWVEYFHNQIKEICTKYRPDGFWFDGTMLDYNWTRMPELVAWIYNNYPEMVLNDRVGCFSQRKVHGDYWTYERGWIKPVHVLPHKWQRDTSMGGGCVYDPKLSLADMAPAERVIWDMIDNVSLGGNYGLFVAPRGDGSIPDYYATRLGEIGAWLKINGEGFHDSRPWLWGYYQEGDNVRYTMSKDQRTVYAFLRGWPGSRVTLEYIHSSIAVVGDVRMLGCDETLTWGMGDRGGAVVDMPDRRPAGVPIYVLKFRVNRDAPEVAIKRDG